MKKGEDEEKRRTGTNPYRLNHNPDEIKKKKTKANHYERIDSSKERKDVPLFLLVGNINDIGNL